MSFQRHKKPFITLMSAGATSQLILLLIAPLLTRLYTPQELGVYGVFVAVSATIAGISGGRLELAIPVAKRLHDATGLLIMTVAIAIPASVLLSIVVTWVSPLFGLDEVLEQRVIGWLPMAACSIVLFQAISYWLLWNKDFSGAARARWVHGSTLAGVQLGAGYLAFGSWGLIVGHTLAQLIGGLLGGGCAVAKQVGRVLPRMSWHKCAVILRRHRNYPFVMAPAALLNMLGQHLPILLIGGLYGVKAAGFYAIAQRVCGAPLTLVGQAIGQIFAAEAPCVMRSSPERMLPLFAKLVKYMLMGGGLFVLLIGTFAPTAAGIVFGEEWVDAGRLMQILSVVFVLEFVVTPVSLTLSFIGSYGRQLWWDVIRLLCILLAFASASVFELSLEAGVTVLAVALSCSHLYLLKLMWVGLRKNCAERGGPKADEDRYMDNIQ